MFLELTTVAANETMDLIFISFNKFRLIFVFQNVIHCVLVRVTMSLGDICGCHIYCKKSVIWVFFFYYKDVNSMLAHQRGLC